MLITMDSSYKLKIGIQPFQVSLDIFESSKKDLFVNCLKSTYERDLGVALIDSLDKLLKKTMIKRSSVRLYEIRSGLGVESAAYKITSAFAEAVTNS